MERKQISPLELTAIVSDPAAQPSHLRLYSEQTQMQPPLL